MSLSFYRDLFELTSGSFRARYGGPASEGEFVRMKAAALAGPPSYLIDGGYFTSGPLLYAGLPVIITRVWAQASGTGTIGLTGIGGTFLLDGGGTVAPSTIDINGIEFPLDSNTIGFTFESGSPKLSLAIYGYTPPTSAP